MWTTGVSWTLVAWHRGDRVWQRKIQKLLLTRNRHSESERDEMGEVSRGVECALGDLHPFFGEEEQKQEAKVRGVRREKKVLWQAVLC